MPMTTARKLVWCMRVIHLNRHRRLDVHFQSRADLSGFLEGLASQISQPSKGNILRFDILYRTAKCLWVIDDPQDRLLRSFRKSAETHKPPAGGRQFTANRKHDLQFALVRQF